MRWFRSNTAEKERERRDSLVNKELLDLHARIDRENKALVDTLNTSMAQVYNDLNAQISRLTKENLMLREDMENGLKRLNFSLSEKDRMSRDDFELAISGLTKYFDKKLELLGDKKGIVTSLLKRIAYLEGQVEEKNASG